VWDRLAPSYITVILLRGAALIKNNEDAVWSFQQAKALLDKVRADLVSTVRCYNYFDPDLVKPAIWCRSDYTGLSVDQLDSEARGTRWVLSTTSYADILETLAQIESFI
ncbi:MAG: hypothetical protein M3Q07_28215, partial [Pseudobdellovibrionaceae bacterium]|nr:hypothetical protein [Pseudobdellovibrionaceae bacterium]